MQGSMRQMAIECVGFELHAHGKWLLFQHHFVGLKDFLQQDFAWSMTN